MLAGDLPPPRRGHQDHTTHSESTPRLLRAGSPRRQQHTDWGRGPSVADVGTPTLWDGSHPSGRKSQWATPDEAWPLSGGCSRSAHDFSGFCVGFFFWLHSWRAGVPGPGSLPMPQQWPTLPSDNARSLTAKPPRNSSIAFFFLIQNSTFII